VYCLVINYRSNGVSGDTREFTLNLFDVLATYFKILLGLVQMNKFACVALEASAVRRSIIGGIDDTMIIQKTTSSVKLGVNIYTIIFAVVATITSAISILFLWQVHSEKNDPKFHQADIDRFFNFSGITYAIEFSLLAVSLAISNWILIN
jgi:hypothetical protein